MMCNYAIILESATYMDCFAGKSGDRELTTAIEQTLETYGIENWGAGYFDVNRKEI